MEEVLDVIQGAVKNLTIPVALSLAAYLLSRGDMHLGLILAVSLLWISAFFYGSAVMFVSIKKIFDLNLSGFYFLSVGLLFITSYVILPVSAFFIAVENLDKLLNVS